MKVLILETPDAAVRRAADIIASVVIRNPKAVLGLATGGTMLPIYARLRELHAAQEFSLASVTTFNLDEYIGLAPDHPCSYHRYMQEALFQDTDIDPSRTHLPAGDSADPAEEAERYEEKITAAGGIDLQLLGLGQNGHIGFNEPTSSLASTTRIKTLTDSTRRANQRYFRSFNETPRYALTVGVGTILASGACLLVATGHAKAKAVAATVEGPVTAACPASALQMHARMTVVLDRAAAADLALVDYYEHVHPGGSDSEFR